MTGYKQNGYFEETRFIESDNSLGLNEYVFPKLEDAPLSPNYSAVNRILPVITIYPAFSIDHDSLHISAHPSEECKTNENILNFRLPILIEENMPIQYIEVSGPLLSDYTEHLYKIKTGPYEFFIPLNQSKSKKLISHICNPSLMSAGQKALKVIILDILKKTNPDCDYLDRSGIGWKCSLPTLSPQVAHNRFEDMQKVILRKWKRPPYAFLRRLMVSKQLAKLFLNQPESEEIQKFCSILKLSMKNEIPLIMQSEDWKTYFCSGPAGQRKYWASIGLKEAELELWFIKNLLDKANTTGQLRIKLPRNSHKSHDILVNLVPSEDVMDHIIRLAMSLNSVVKKYHEHHFITGSTLLKVQPKCWSPVYQKSSKMLRLSALITSKDSKQSICFVPADRWDGYKSHVSYLTSGIIGETDFVVGNGKYKILQLPKGSYRYTLKSLPNNSLRWYPSLLENKSSGEITWSSKRPRPIIKKW